MDGDKLVTREVDVLRWGYARGLIQNGCAKTQCLKTVSELGELSDAIIKGEDVKDHIGDVLVTLIMICGIKETSLNECLETAWNEIKDRKGRTVNGNFIKDVRSCNDCRTAECTGDFGNANKCVQYTTEMRPK